MIDDQLHGLITPNREAGFNSELWLGLALFACLLALAIYRWLKMRNAPMSMAKRKLQHLIQSQTEPTKNTQSTALTLVTILCDAYGAKRLDQIQQNNFNNRNRSKDWADFQNQLNTACYAKNSSQEITSLLTKAQQWLETK